MRTLTAITLSLSLAASCAYAQTTDPATEPPTTQPSTQPAPQYGKPIATDINPGQMITYKAGTTGRDIPAYLVTPKGLPGGDKAPRPAVIVVPDIFGMTDWIKTQADSLAKQGYTVIVPNLFSRLPGSDKPLTPQQAWLDYDQTSDGQIRDDLSAAIEFLQEEGKPTAAQPLAVVGYDMGGVYAMMLAGNDLRVSAAVNYYGRILYANTTHNRPISPVEDLFNLHAPLLSFYGTNDPQIPEDHIRALDSRLAHNPNQIYYEIVRFPAVGHGFLVPTRQGYNPAAASQSTEKTQSFLARYLRPEPKKSDE